MSKQKTERDIFDEFVDRVLSVPHSEILQRENEYQKQQANKSKRGPKRKVKPSASGHESDDKD